jgi:hypothetical protein
MTGPTDQSWTTTLPPKGADPEQDEAYEKVENYLRACRVSSHLQRARLTALMLQRAAARRAAGGPGNERPLPELAIEEARNLIQAWVVRILPPRTDERPHSPSEAFSALYLCDAPTRWPGVFLDPQEVPPGFLDVLRARLVKAGPDLQVSSVVPRPMDFGLATAARVRLEGFPRLAGHDGVDAAGRRAGRAVLVHPSMTAHD